MEPFFDGAPSALPVVERRMSTAALLLILKATSRRKTFLEGKLRREKALCSIQLGSRAREAHLTTDATFANLMESWKMLRKREGKTSIGGNAFRRRRFWHLCNGFWTRNQILDGNNGQCRIARIVVVLMVVMEAGNGVDIKNSEIFSHNLLKTKAPQFFSGGTTPTLAFYFTKNELVILGR